MIGFLKGKVLEVDLDAVIVDVGGVGYLVKTMSDLPSPGSLVSYYIYTYVKEDEISLYGFSDKKTQKVFEYLISVSGIGPRIAVSILSKYNSDEIIKAISTADVDLFTSVSGVGKKGAQKIIIELKTKIGGIEDLDLIEKDSDLINGLTSLGYDKAEIKQALRHLDVDLSDDQKVREIIKQMGKK